MVDVFKLRGGRGASQAGEATLLIAISRGREGANAPSRPLNATMVFEWLCNISVAMQFGAATQ